MSANKHTKEELLEVIKVCETGVDVMQEIRRFLFALPGMTKKEIRAYLPTMVQIVDRLGDKKQTQTLCAIIDKTKGFSQEAMSKSLQSYFNQLHDTVLIVMKKCFHDINKANNKTVF